MDTTQAKQIALDWLALNAHANAPTADVKVTESSFEGAVYIKLTHLEIERMSVELEVSYTRPGAYYEDSEGNTRGKLELRLTANWAAYGSVDLTHVAAHASLIQDALSILAGLKSVLPAELDVLVTSAEEKALRIKTRKEEVARDAALVHVATHKLTSHLRVGGTKTAPVTLADAQVTLNSYGKVYSVAVESGLLTVTRVH